MLWYKSPSFEMQFLGDDFGNKEKRREAVKQNNKDIFIVAVVVWGFLIGFPLLLKVLFG